MISAYLDNNIFVYLENGSLKVKSLHSLFDTGVDVFFYSSAHIQELLERKGEGERQKIERIKSRLDILESVTECNYLYHELPSNKVYKIKSKPCEVLNTIQEVTFANPVMKSILNSITEEQRQSIRDQLGLETSQLNNYKPEEVIRHLNGKLSGLGEGLSFLDLIEKGIGFNPQGKSFGIHNRIAGIFELLDFLGYWKDKYTPKSNYARLWDSLHTYFASYCTYFISDDKRTRNKAKVVYEMYGIKCKIISSRGI